MKELEKKNYKHIIGGFSSTKEFLLDYVFTFLLVVAVEPLLDPLNKELARKFKTYVGPYIEDKISDSMLSFLGIGARAFVACLLPAPKKKSK